MHTHLQVAFMFNEWYKPESTLEFPVGGSQAMADALARGVRRRGGRVHVRSHVEQIVLDATLWDVRTLLPPGALPEGFERGVEELPETRSFMHLHVGFDAAGIAPEMHHIVVNTWHGGVDSEQNVVLISIASVADPTMAPEGKHVLHAYTPATEPFGIWEGLDRKSEEYARLKEERSQVRPLLRLALPHLSANWAADLRPSSFCPVSLTAGLSTGRCRHVRRVCVLGTARRAVVFSGKMSPSL